MEDSQSPLATLTAVAVAGFLMPFMLSGVGISLPSIGHELNANAVQLGLVETGYMASVSIFMLAMGRLGDIHGRALIFKTGIAIFAVVAGLLSFAPSIEAVILLRFAQGMGGAMAASTGPAIVVSAFPAERRGRALGLLVAAIYGGLSLGPTLGGYLVTHFGWRSLFRFVAVWGAFVAVLTYFRLKENGAESAGEKFDARGAVLYALAVLLLTWGSASLGKGAAPALALAGGILLMGVFLFVETITEHPLIHMGLLTANRVFALSNLAALLNYAATFGITFFFSLYLQYVKGFSPSEAGLLLAVQPVSMALLSPACGYLADRMSAGIVATAGMSLCAAGLALAVFVGPDTPMWAILALFLLMGTGFALFSSPNMNVIMGSVEKKHLGVASGLSSSMRTLGMTASMIVITVVLSVYMGENPVNEGTRLEFMRSMRVSLTVFAFLCACGIFFSLGRLRGAEEPG